MRLIVLFLSVILTINRGSAQDLTPPTAVCKSSVIVSLSYGQHYISATDIDNGSYDNVGIVSYQIRRMDDPCGIPSNLDFGNSIALCCADVGRRFMVVLQVQDQAGNLNQCMGEIVVQDKTAPSLICLPDITVSCKYKGYPPHFFGKFVQNPNDREKIIIGGKLWGKDGIYSGGCGQYPIQESSNFIKGDCSSSHDQLIRTFTFPNFPGQNCTQTITFVPETVFEIRDISCFNEDPTDGVIWPCDYNASGCNASSDLSPEVTGKPELVKGDQCGLVATNYHDQSFHVAGTACRKIIREWIVFDWCTERRWNYTQIILVTESEKPTFENCVDTTLYSRNIECDVASYNYRLQVKDDCTPYDSLHIRFKLDLFSDGVIDTTALSDSLSLTIPIGEHILFWDVDDGCSNVASCSWRVNVVDGKAPTPLCRTGIVTVIMPIFGEIDIEASSLDIGSFDNCTDEDKLRFSFSDTMMDSVITITCDSIELHGSDTFQRRVFVWDESGNIDYCTVNLIVQDPNEFCSSSTVTTVKGKIFGIQNDSFGGTVFKLIDLTDQVLLLEEPVVGTRFEHTINLPNYMANRTAEISLEKRDEVDRGLTVADLVLLQRHILGIEKIADPLLLLAADINSSGELNTKDLATLRRILLGLPLSGPFSFDSPWHFIDSDLYHTTGEIRSKITIPFAEIGLKPCNYEVVKTGDINRSLNFQEHQTEKRNKEFLFYAKKDNSSAYHLISFELRSSQINELSGFQGTFSFDPTQMEFVGISSGKMKVNTQNINLSKLQEGVVPMLWSNPGSVLLERADHMFTLLFRAKAQHNTQINPSIDFGSYVLRAECVDTDGNILKPILQEHPEDDPLVSQTVISKVYPNPTDGSIVISIESITTQVVHVRVFNIMGQLVYGNSASIVRGHNQIPLNLGSIAAPGVYFIETRVGETKRIQKVQVY